MSLPYRVKQKTQAALLVTLLFTASVAHAAYTAPTIGEMGRMTTVYEDTMIDLAMKHRVGYAQLMAANQGVDPWLPGANRKLVLPNWHIIPDVERKGLILNTGELRLYYFPSDGSAPRTFPIGIGREGLSSPKGSSTVTRKQADPVWRPTPRMRLEDPELPAEVHKGPDNPLGAYALYMGWPSYLIHGTNKPKAIGRRASSGCIRMYDNEIEWLFKNVPVGTKITSINQPIKMAWIDDAFFIEAEPNDLQVDEIEYQNRQITIDVPDGTIEQVRKKAGDRVNEIDWEKVRNVLIERTGIPTQVSKGPQHAIPMAANEEPSSPTKHVEKDAAKAYKKVAEEKPQGQNKNKNMHNDWDNLNH